MKTLKISNAEKNSILESHGFLKKNVAIVELLSLDEKYAIFLDELYDIEEKKNLGNVWENLSNFKLFFESSLNHLQNQVQEPILKEFRNGLDNLLITESDSKFLKEEFMNLINEDWWDSVKSGVSDFTGWAKEKGKEAYQGVKSTAQTIGKGLEQFKNAISKGEWSEVMSILGKGTLFLARKLRSALYNPIGLIFDAILVASGIGKTAQFVIWGVVVALDIYELVTGDYENKDESFLMRLLFTGVDIIGLVFAGVAAKSARTTIAGIFRRFGTSNKGLSQAAKSSPAFKGILEQIQSAAKGASTKMSQVGAYLQKNSPKIYTWFSGIIGGLGKIVKKIIDTIGGILKGAFKVVSAPGKAVKNVLGGGRTGKGAQAALNTTSIVYGTEKLAGGKPKEIEVPNVDFSQVEWDFSKGF
jgi:hypothetical protein